MRRWIAVLLLVVAASFLAASGADPCGEGPAGHSQGSQHLLCIDDCTPALVPEPSAPPPAQAMPRTVYEETVARPILTLDLEPEKEPPRA